MIVCCLYDLNHSLFQFKEYVKLTTEENVYTFSWEEWGEINNEESERYNEDFLTKLV